MEIKEKTIKGVKWSTVITFANASLQALQYVILARLLEPSAFGLMGIVITIITFSQLFLDMGISNAIIHKQEITKNQLSTLYWLNVFAGFITFAMICIIAPIIANFYNEPVLKQLLVLAGIYFIITPFGQQFRVLLQKDIRFFELAKIEITGRVISTIASAFLAYKGYGAYALVYGFLAGTIIQTIQCLNLGLKEYGLKFAIKIVEIKEFLMFGFYQVATNTVNYFAFQIDTLLIGKLLGMDALGIYTIAKQIIMYPAMLINPTLTKVTFPSMAKVQHDMIYLKRIYLKSLNYLCLLNFPIYTFIFFFSNEIVLTLLGSRYNQAIDVIKILAIYGAIISTGNPVGTLILAKGKASLAFWWTLFVSIYLCVSVFVGSFWGIMGISFSLLFLQMSLVIPNWFFLVKPLCGAKFIEYHKVIFIPGLIAISTGTVAYVLVMNIPLGIIKLFMGGILISLLTFVLYFLYSKEFLTNLKELVR